MAYLYAIDRNSDDISDITDEEIRDCGVAHFIEEESKENSKENEEEPQFVCNVCSKSFAHERALKNHMKSHEESKVADAEN